MNWNDYLPGWVIEALEHIAVLWEKGHYVKAGGWVTLAGLAIASCVILFWLAVCALLDIFLRYSVEICVVVGVPVGLWLAWKRRGKGNVSPAPACNGADEELARQEAADIHDDLRTLVYNAVDSASENTPLRRPRDEMSIESNRDTKFRMDEMMAVHQFEVDYEGDMDGAMQDAILRELQRQVNKYSSRYPLLLRDGRPPVVYDLSKASNFLVVEVVLYSEDHKDKIEARRRARVIRQQKVADTYDPDF